MFVLLVVVVEIVLVIVVEVEIVIDILNLVILVGEVVVGYIVFGIDNIFLFFLVLYYFF